MKQNKKVVMKIRIKDGFFYRVEEGADPVIIGVCTDGFSDIDERIIECGTEALPAVEKFIADVNSGSFKPRTAVKELERVLDKYPQI